MDSCGAARLCGLLLLAVGCQHQAATMPSPGPVSPNAASPQTIDPSQVKKVSAKPKELPPQVLVSSADFKSGEAAAAEDAPERQQQIRELARQDYEKAIKLNPKYVPAYQGLARLYVAMHESEQAIETYQKALQIESKNAVLWYELAMYHNTQKSWEEALNCLSRALKVDPSNRNYINATGVVLAEAGRYEESLTYFVRTSGEAKGCYRLALTLDRLQQPGLSRYYLETALRKDPNLATTMNLNLNQPVQQTAYTQEGSKETK